MVAGTGGVLSFARMNRLLGSSGGGMGASEWVLRNLGSSLCVACVLAAQARHERRTGGGSACGSHCGVPYVKRVLLMWYWDFQSDKSSWYKCLE